MTATRIIYAAAGAPERNDLVIAEGQCWLCGEVLAGQAQPMRVSVGRNPGDATDQYRRGDEMPPFLTPADFLARGLSLPPLSVPSYHVPPGTHCAITGQPLKYGYRVSDMVTDATAEFLDCFRGGVHGWVGETAARCFKSANPHKGNPTARSVMAFDDGTLWNPLISAESAATQGRRAWRDLVRQIWPARRGQQCLMILTTDMKKRLWIRARIGTLGARTPLLYYDGKTAGNEVLFLNWPQFLATLDIIENVYSLGFLKEAIGSSLYAVGKVCQVVGLTATREMEKQLASLRGTPEFQAALLIAQKNPQEDESIDDSDR